MKEMKQVKKTKQQIHRAIYTHIEKKKKNN